MQSIKTRACYLSIAGAFVLLAIVFAFLTPPRPKEPYRLLGTILPRSENTPPKAIIQSTAGNKTYIVTPGESLDANTEVVRIAGKQVVLSTDGKQRTLRLLIRF